MSKAPHARKQGRQEKSKKNVNKEKEKFTPVEYLLFENKSFFFRAIVAVAMGTSLLVESGEFQQHSLKVKMMVLLNPVG